MRDFVVKHPVFSIHAFFMPIGFALAAMGLTLNEVIVAGFVMGIPYALISERWEQAAARDRRRKNRAIDTPESLRIEAARPIHPQ